MIDYVKAWQCIGCGKIEAPQTCIGVCRDRRVEFVHAEDYEETLAQLNATQQRLRAAILVLRALASITPRNGEWERGYRAAQDQARRILTASSV